MRAAQKSKDAFRTISEVSAELDVPQHVLRFWETKFAQVKPMKRGGNRRYYRPEDIELLHAIRHYLYADGYTIKGVQKLLRERGPKGAVKAWKAAVRGEAKTVDSQESKDIALTAAPADRDLMLAVLDELKALRRFIEDYEKTD